MSERIVSKDESFDEASLVGIVKNRPTGLAAAWLVLSLLMMGYGILHWKEAWFLLIIGLINLLCALLVLSQVKQYTAIRVYKDRLLLTDHKDHHTQITVKNEEISSWEIDQSNGNTLILNLLDQKQIQYRVTQSGKVNRLLCKTIGSKEKNEKELEQFRQNNDKTFVGIKDIGKIMRKRGKDHEEKH